jgi:hypothetical protein
MKGFFDFGKKPTEPVLVSNEPVVEQVVLPDGVKKDDVQKKMVSKNIAAFEVYREIKKLHVFILGSGICCVISSIFGVKNIVGLVFLGIFMVSAGLLYAFSNKKAIYLKEAYNL